MPLNNRQSEAVRYIDGPCLVLAGAGSGKTSVITQKIAYLIEECGYHARNIAAVTFTNKAAREMKARVGKLIKGRASHGLAVSTFHTLGLNIIRKEVTKIGYKPGFSIFDAEDARALLKELMLKESDFDNDMLDRIQNQISQWKTELQSPGHIQSRAENQVEQIFALVYQRYNEALQAYNAIDFDDLIRLPTELFQQSPEVLVRWQKRIRYLLVDEYQDTNSSQYELVKLLLGNRNGLTVVGDDDQSIYAWRGAKPENLAQLTHDYPNLKVIKLEQNYRSKARILKVANEIISHNPHVFEKKLWSELGVGELIRVVKCVNEDAEGERVANEILNQKLRRRAQFKDFAILYRGNYQARQFEIKLQQAQIPYHISGGTSFFAKTEIKDLMAYLRLLINPDDDNAFLRIINTPRRQIGTSTLEGLGRYATENSLSMLEACNHLGLQAVLNEKSIQRLQQFYHWLEGVKKNCHNNNPVSGIRELIEDIDYEGWLHQNASSPKVAEKRVENIYYLIDQIKRNIENDLEEDMDGEERLNQAISKMILIDMLDRQEEENDEDRVSLMTLHASKGLEFPHVFMVGFEEEILPHRTSIEENNIEEERRLTYVGITRAKETLTITLAASRKQYGEKVETSPSRFLEEIPGDDTEMEGFGNASEIQVEKKGNETLTNLKMLFDD